MASSGSGTRGPSSRSGDQTGARSTFASGTLFSSGFAQGMLEEIAAAAQQRRAQGNPVSSSPRTGNWLGLRPSPGELVVDVVWPVCALARPVATMLAWMVACPVIMLWPPT